MKHRATPRSWSCYRSLPAEIRELADRGYKLLQTNPRHPSLHFKKVGEFWSVRVGLHYRAWRLKTAMICCGSGLGPTPNTIS